MARLVNITPQLSADAVRASLHQIMAGVHLCTIATCGSDGTPSAATAFFVLDEDDLVLHLMTGPDTTHGRHLLENPSVAITVFSTDQSWTDKKRGLQIFATGALTPAMAVPGVLGQYLARYRGVRGWIKGAADLPKTGSRFFSLTIDRVKLLDEPAFGERVHVQADVVRG